MGWMGRWSVCLFLLVGFLASTAFGATTTSVFTDCTDFVAGASSNAECVAGSINLVADEGQTSNIIPVIWVPNSDTGSVSKVDTLTGRELGRYMSSPYNDYTASPSRTTVDINGNVWFGNRGIGTAVKIGLNENGQCVDRNGNGIVETSTDLDADGNIQGAEILPWGTDECVLLELLLDPSNPSAAGSHVPGAALSYNGFGPRGFAIDKNNNIWVGGTGSSLMYNVDGGTGAILGYVDVSLVGGGYSSYGAFADSNGIIWTNTGWSNLTKINPNITPPEVSNYFLPNGYQAYGIAPDSNNNVIFTDWGWMGVGKYNTASNTVDWHTSHESLNYSPRGVAVSMDGDIWTANSGGNGVTRLGSDGVVKAVIGTNYAPAGVSIDREGKVWAVDLWSENIIRIDPATNSIDLTKQLVGAGSHYGYSDMIGLISNATAQYQGAWVVDHDSGLSGTPWGKLNWNATVPTGAAMIIKVRSSENLSSWSDWETAVNGQLLSTIPDGRYLQVQVTFSKNQSVTSNVTLNDLTIVQHTVPYADRDGILTLTVNPLASPTNLAVIGLGGAVDAGAEVTVLNQTTAEYGSATVTNGSWVGTVTLISGDNSIRVTATAGLDNVQIVRTVRYDGQSPTVSITAPTTGGQFKNPVDFGYVAGDNQGINSYQFIVNGKTVSTTPPGSALTLDDGLNVIKLVATDAAGNVGFDEVSIVVDNFAYPPSIDPLPTTWQQGSYTVTGKTEPGSIVTVSANPTVTVGPVSVTDGTWSCVLSNLSTGTFVVSASATDALSNASTVATASLQVALTLSPVMVQATDTYQGGKVNLNWSSYSGVGVASYNLYYSPLPFTTVTGMTPVRSFAPTTKSYMATGLTNGKFAYFAVVAVDGEGAYNANVTTTQVTPTRQGIEGYVTDATSKPLQAILVNISGVGFLLTNNQGYYSLSGLSPASYSVSFSENPAQRYFDNSGNVTVVAGQMATLNTTLAVKAVLPPSAPTGLAATANDRKVNLVWSPVLEADVAGYNLYRDGVKVNFGLLTQAKYTDSALSNGVNYSYVVKAVNNAGTTESEPSNTVNATPVAALPDAPKDLMASLQCDGSVVLTWTAPASSNISGYNIYYQSGTVLGYGSIAGTTSGTIWTSPALTAGSYTFGVRTVASAEEANQYVVATVNVPTNWGAPKGSIKIPQAGKKVSGNSLHVHADISTCGATEETSQVLFQYKSGAGSWLDIPASSVQHPNPDAEGPAFFIQWDVMGLTEGPYQLRAVASNGSGVSDAEPGAITVYVDHAAPDYREDIDNSGKMKSVGGVESGRQNQAVVETEVTKVKIDFNATALKTDAELKVQTLIPAELAEKSDPKLMQAVDLELSSGQKNFDAGSEPEVAFGYKDENNDGYIDGSGLEKDDMEVASWDETTEAWVSLPGAVVDAASKKIKGITTHFSMFGLKGKEGNGQSSAPGQLHAASSSKSGSYEVSWDEVLDAGIYIVEEATDSNFTQGVRIIHEGPAKLTTVNGRKNGIYWYRVKSGKKGANPSDWTVISTPVQVTLGCEIPTALTAQVDSTAGKVDLSWSSDESVGTYFEIEMDNGGGYVVIASTTQKTIQSNIGNGNYKFRIKARRAGVDDSDYTTEVSVSMALACATPATIAAANSAGTINLNWTVSATSGVNYMLQESVNGGPFVTIYLGSLNQLALTGRTGTSYLYRVKAQKSGLTDSSWKAMPTPVAGTPRATCKAISGIYAPISNITGSFQVSWTKSSTAGVTYNLYETGITDPIYSGSDNYFNVTGKLDGTYSYSVKAIKSGYSDSPVKGPVSISVTLTVAPITGLYAPENNSTGNYQVSWSKSATADVTYNLYQTGIVDPIYSGPNNYFNVTGNGNGSYSYSVQATKTGHAASAVKGPVTTTVAIVIAPISAIYAPLSNTTGNFQVSWKKSSMLGVNYILEEDNGTGWTIVAPSPGTNNYVSFKGKAGGTYSYRVTATLGALSSVPNKTVTIQVNR